MTGQKAPQMIYRHLGRTGLKVSRCSDFQKPRQMIHAHDYVMPTFPEHSELSELELRDESVLSHSHLVAALSSGLP